MNDHQRGFTLISILALLLFATGAFVAMLSSQNSLAKFGRQLTKKEKIVEELYLALELSEGGFQKKSSLPKELRDTLSIDFKCQPINGNSYWSCSLDTLPKVLIWTPI